MSRLKILLDKFFEDTCKAASPEEKKGLEAQLLFDLLEFEVDELKDTASDLGIERWKELMYVISRDTPEAYVFRLIKVAPRAKR